MQGVTISRHESGGKGEYHAHVAGSTRIGRLTWVERDGIRAAEHTLVPEEIGGRGIAALLVETLVADARAQGFKVRPVCSYVVNAFREHPDWADVRA